jgi:hypothetical protein
MQLNVMTFNSFKRTKTFYINNRILIMRSEFLKTYEY